MTEKKHGNTGNQNAAKGKDRSSRLNIGVNKTNKAGWVQAALADSDCKNLTDWVIKTLNEKTGQTEQDG